MLVFMPFNHLNQSNHINHLYLSVLNHELATTFKTMLANHGPFQKQRPNPLTMPPKRIGMEGSGLGTPPLSSGQVGLFRIDRTIA